MDHEDAIETVASSPVLASCRDLTHVQVVVASLLRRMNCVVTNTEEHKEANNDETNDIVGTESNSQLAHQSGLGTTRDYCQNGCNDPSVGIDGENDTSQSRRNIKRKGGAS